VKVGSLFSGIGGLDLGLERAGMTVAWQSEIDPYASRVLAKHWPTVPNLGDITTIDWSSVEHVDLICGGYPCQPFSLAGVRQGESDPRHLWPHFHTAIRHLRPRHAVLENVPGHLSMGFGRVLGDLAEIGYDTEWCSVPAAAVGAPHLRYRIFAIATDTRSERRRQNRGSTLGDESQDAWRATQDDHVAGGDGPVGAVADTDGGGQSRHKEVQRRGRTVFGGEQCDANLERCGATVADTDSGRREQRHPKLGRLSVVDEGGAVVAHAEGKRRSPLRAIDATETGTNAFPGHAGQLTRGDAWAVEPDVGRVAHGIPSRVDRLRCLGNAVVPQVAEWIGHQIMTAAA
jgi:DNA (cytosine-5)-methyltransferase 1